MLSKLECIGFLVAPPKRKYRKDGKEISLFRLMVKRNDNSNNYDSLDFVAYGNPAKFINDYVNDKSTVYVIARPRNFEYTNKNNVKVKYTGFVVKEIGIICNKSKLQLDQFGASSIPEYPELNYDLWRE